MIIKNIKMLQTQSLVLYDGVKVGCFSTGQFPTSATSGSCHWRICLFTWVLMEPALTLK